MRVLLAFLLVFLMPSYVHGNEFSEQITYIHSDKKSQARTAAIVDDGILVFGPRQYLKFNGKFESAHFTGPLKLDGVAQYVRSDKDGNLIIAGLNRKAFDLLSKDNRQNIIARMNPNKLASSVLKFRELNDRVSYGLEINNSSQPVLLSGGGGHYTLSVFSNSLDNIRKSTQFGNGQSGSLAITDQGNYIVLGFDLSEDSNDVAATFWEFSPELELLSTETLGRFKKRSQGSAVMSVLTYKDNVYLAYGWDQSGVKEENPDEVWLKKIKGSPAWQEEQKLPYYVGMRFFTEADGTPYVLYPRVDNIHKVVFDFKEGRSKRIILNRPLEPVQCFPPNWKYGIVDVLIDPQGNTKIVINGNPLNHPEAGCVTIGLLDESKNKEDPISYILNAENTASWRAVDQGFSIKLTDNAKREFFELTKNNINKPLALYVGDFLVTSPIIREPIGGGSLMLAIDEEMQSKLLSLLPADKEIKQ